MDGSALTSNQCQKQPHFAHWAYNDEDNDDCANYVDHGDNDYDDMLVIMMIMVMLI